MPLLKAEADKLTNPSLQRFFVEVLIDRGAPDLMSQLPFKSVVGKSYDFVVEDAIGSGNSARDPYGTSIASGGGNNVRYTVPAQMFIRDADTAEIDIIGKSDYFDAHANDIMKQAKKLAQDFLYQFINARVDEGGTHTSYNIRGVEHWMDKYAAKFPEQRLFLTDDSLVSGTAQNLALNDIDDLLSRYKGERFDAMYMDRQTWVYVKGLLNAAGGNTAEMLMNDKFGRAMLHYDGVPIVISDAVGVQKNFDSHTVTGTTVVVDDAEFLGFSTLDVGSTITLNGGTAAIDSVTDSHTVVIDDATGITTGTGSFNVAAKNVIYALRFDDIDGICAFYHADRGVPADAGEYYGPIAGFNADFMGEIEAAPRHRTRLSWYGNVVLHNGFAAATASHYALG